MTIAPRVTVTHFIVVADPGRAAAFYVDVLGAALVRSGLPTMVSLDGATITMSVGGGPTPDKPDVTLVPPTDLSVSSAFLNLRVSDIWHFYELWLSRGAVFLTPPIDRGEEIRCYLRDLDGHLIEVGQSAN